MRKVESVPAVNTDPAAIEFARYFLRLANLPNFALDRLSRYETSLWRRACRILHALERLDRRKPQKRMRWRFPVDDRRKLPGYERDEC
jgi:hypothetical protein